MLPLRVLVVLPMYGGSLPVGRYCVQALRDLGHTVEVFEAPHFYTAFDGLKSLHITAERLEQVEGSFLHVISQAILAQVESFEPDCVLALAQAPMSRQLLRRLQKEHIPTAMWFVEDHKIFTYWRAFAPLYTVFAVIQKEPFLSALVEAGQKNALYLPMAALPTFHCTQKLSVVEQKTYGADVAFLGAGYPNRRVAFRSLIAKDFKIWGTDWDGDSILARHVQQGGARISAEDAVKVYTATKININLHSSVQAQELVPAGDFVNPRTFELASMGVFQLVDKRQLMDELFDKDTLATFTNLEELLEKIDYYLVHPEERQALAAAARTTIMERHTYQHRMQCLLDYMAEVHGLWKKRQSAKSLPEELPENMREELGALLDSVHLPADAAFVDLIARIRQRTGVLSPLETTLLFLDEWRKQYTK